MLHTFTIPYKKASGKSIKEIKPHKERKAESRITEMLKKTTVFVSVVMTPP